MSKQHVHFAALGFEPLRMKPVHLADGFFLALTETYYQLELLNKVSVFTNKKGLQKQYEPEALRQRLVDDSVIAESIDVAQLKALREHVGVVTDNDDAVFAAFEPYKTFGNDYTLVSESLITAQKRLDGYSGHFLRKVFESTEEGQSVVQSGLSWITTHDSSIEQLLLPLVEGPADAIHWNNPYDTTFGELSDERIEEIADLMNSQTEALARLCRNIDGRQSRLRCLRSLIIGLCGWLLVYEMKVAAQQVAAPMLLMDFSNNSKDRLRALSRIAYARRRESVFNMYARLHREGNLDCPESDYVTVQNAGFKFLEQHFTDVAVRSGFAQPRAFQVRAKHFELQADTARVLVTSVLPEASYVMPLGEVATSLRGVWGVCFGGCDDDLEVLRSEGFTGLDSDEDLAPNRRSLIDLFKKLGLASEPSDGLVLCSADPEALL